LNAWISGVSGFIGTHLARRLLEKGMDVTGIYYHEEELARMKALDVNINLLKVDIRDYEEVKKSIEGCSPQRIYHMAAQSFPTVSWDKPVLTMDINANGTINVFEAVKEMNLETRILVACSSAQYGFVTPEEVPVNEEHPMRPLHPYGVSKVAQDLLAYQYFKNFDIDTVRVRLFNCTGPSKTNDAPSDFSEQVVKIEKGLMENKLAHGNLSSERDFTDVRDMVEAFEALMEKGVKGDVYNACSSKPLLIQDMLNTLVSLSTTQINIQQDPARMRPSDEPIILGDNTKLRTDTGWEPKVPFEQTLADMLEYWRMVL
jgi:GDP-4-dehydro-6-deoxy-D-mannose reductase